LGNDADHLLDLTGIVRIADVFAVVQDLPGGRAGQHGKHPDGGSLAGAVWPQQTENFTGADGQGKIFHSYLFRFLILGIFMGKCFSEIFNFNHTLCPSASMPGISVQASAL